MTEVKKSRRERSRATRKAIVAAAHDEFSAHGFHGATIRTIAERAGIAEQTVYFVFHTKANLISAVIDSAVMGDVDPRPPQTQDWWQEMVAEPNAERALELFVRGAGSVFARTSAIFEVLRAAATTDDEVATTYRQHQQMRRTAFGEMLDNLAAKGALRSSFSRDELLDIFLVVYSEAAYHRLTVETGWPHDRVMDWLCADLPRILLEPEHESRSRT